MLRMKREKCASDSHGGSFTCARVSRSPALYTRSGGGYRFSSYLYTEVSAQRPGGWRWNVMILPPRDTAVFVLFRENRLGPGIWFFFLAGSPTWLLKAAWTKTRTGSIYLYNTTYIIGILSGAFGMLLSCTIPPHETVPQ